MLACPANKPIAGLVGKCVHVFFDANFCEGEREAHGRNSNSALGFLIPIP